MAYSTDVKAALEIASSMAKEYNHATWGPAHLLKALLHNDIGLASVLASLKKDIHYIREWAEVRLENYPKALKLPAEPGQDKETAKVLEVADLIRLQTGKDYADPLCVFAALLKPGLAFSHEQLKSFPITQQEALLFDSSDKTLRNEKASEQVALGSITSDALGKYCIERTNQEALSKSDPVMGRETELRQIIEVFGRRTKPNVIITGEPGVGKSALITGLARKIAGQSVPPYLKGCFLFELNTGALAAGATYKGEIEDRISKVLNELKTLPKAILFIDEIHSIIDSKSSLQGIAGILKPELARGELTIIGVTTPEDYQKYIEQDETFSRRFEVIRIEEPDMETAIRMIESIMPSFERHHGIKLDPGAVKESVQLCKRYIRERSLPDAAIDLLDRAMASVKNLEGMLEDNLQELEHAISAIKESATAESFREYTWILQKLKNGMNPIALSNNIEKDLSTEGIESGEELKNALERVIMQIKYMISQKKESVSSNDIALVMASKTGIPVGKIRKNEREKLTGMEDVLKERVVGQNHAIHVLSESIIESRSGLIKGNQPIGSFFLLGPTGTGKTELAKALADFLFNDESYLIRFDMSEFKEEHSAALLYGAPPGYVGYEEGGMLVNKIRQKPYSVVLFDEIEKAHPSVYDLFLQIMDEGKLHDRLGKTGDFSNAVVLFTSNIGSEFVARKFENKEMPSSDELMEIMTRYFRPEFLARLTEIVPFSPITEDNLVKIFDIHLNELVQLLNKQGITLEITQGAKRQIAFEGFTPAYGVRPLKGVIRNKLRRPISRMIIQDQLLKGSLLNISTDSENNLVWNITGAGEPAKDLLTEESRQLISDLQ